MVLDNYRSSLDWWLVPLAKALRRVHPNTFTWLSLLAAMGGFVAFWQSDPATDRGVWMLLLGWGLILINSVLDLLDGKVATMTGQASPKGDYLDHAIDRFSDTLFILGIAFSPWVRLEIGVLALVGTLLTSYLGTQAQAVGIGRNYGGLLGRADRMVLLLLIPLLEVISHFGGLAYFPDRVDWTLSYLDMTMLYFAVVGILTTVQRFMTGLRAFDAGGQLK